MVRAKHIPKTKRIQCKYCIQVLTSEARYARHIETKHPEKVEEYIHEGH